MSIWLPRPSSPKDLCIGLVVGATVSIVSILAFNSFTRPTLRNIETEPPADSEVAPIELRTDQVVDGVLGLIGNTPLVRINSLSDALGVEILGKAEFLNPGGSVKDRVALRMIEAAEQDGLLYPNTRSMIFEGTSGSTGISLATVARAKGYETTIILPDDIAEEKAKAILALGGIVEKVKPASIVDKKQFVNIARERAREFNEAPNTHGILDDEEKVTPASLRDSSSVPSTSKPRGFFADQFENMANFDAHLKSTGPEIWRQTGGRVDAFVSGAGTGGTLAGVGTFLKSIRSSIVVALADPEGSGLYHKVKSGVMFDPKESEGTRRRHQVDTLVEGIGLNRLTQNIDLALPLIDDAFRVTDMEAINMSRHLAFHDGLFLGSSSACNLVACVQLVKKLKWNDGQTVVTILCDSGSRHFSKFWYSSYF
ncbi:PALP-domain-containing protein [Sistotremastrum niveocremeum HHB9708]|uniref:cysteine synthase n=1 Tax=Sistotremastrum niveocremeum HHB9708 TaxID=1314777 RepID=A0A165A6K5_9AGAM|nr:PALP-domain-containing protein [Sistotremastrum niveocremeum HHB9708]